MNIVILSIIQIDYLPLLEKFQVPQNTLIGMKAVL